MEAGFIAFSLGIVTAFHQVGRIWPVLYAKSKMSRTLFIVLSAMFSSAFVKLLQQTLVSSTVLLLRIFWPVCSLHAPPLRNCVALLAVSFDKAFCGCVFVVSRQVCTALLIV